MTPEQIEEWRVKIKNKIWSDFCAEPDEEHGRKLMAQFDALCDLALQGLTARRDALEEAAAHFAAMPDSAMYSAHHAAKCIRALAIQDNRLPTAASARLPSSPPQVLKGSEATPSAPSHRPHTPAAGGGHPTSTHYVHPGPWSPIRPSVTVIREPDAAGGDSLRDFVAAQRDLDPADHKAIAEYMRAAHPDNTPTPWVDARAMRQGEFPDHPHYTRFVFADDARSLWRVASDLATALMDKQRGFDDGINRRFSDYALAAWRKLNEK